MKKHTYSQISINRHVPKNLFLKTFEKSRDPTSSKLMFQSQFFLVRWDMVLFQIFWITLANFYELLCNWGLTLLWINFYYNWNNFFLSFTVSHSCISKQFYIELYYIGLQLKKTQTKPSITGLFVLHMGLVRADLSNGLNSCIIGKKLQYLILNGFSIKYLKGLTFKINKEVYYTK